MPLVRFSLRTALLMTTIAAMAITIALFWREIGPLRAEVRRLRSETGQLSIDDPKKIYAIAVTSPPPIGHVWKWRVYIPPGKQYWQHTQLGTIAAKGTENINGSRSSAVLEPGENVLEFATGKDETGEWQIHNSVKQIDERLGALRARIGGTMTVGPHHAWLDGIGGWSAGGVTEQLSQAFDTEKPVELLRLRAGTSPATITSVAGKNNGSDAASVGSGGEADGILIWIDDKP